MKVIMSMFCFHVVIINTERDCLTEAVRKNDLIFHVCRMGYEESEGSMQC